MRGSVDLLEGLGGVSLVAFKDSECVVTLDVAILNATVAEQERNCGQRQHGLYIKFEGRGRKLKMTYHAGTPEQAQHSRWQGRE